jgi:hypothetical protein
MKNLIFVLLLFTQNAKANWVIFYEHDIFDAKLLLSSVQQDDQKTQALVVLNFKDKLFFDGVGSQAILLEHICGETSPNILEEQFYEGRANVSKVLNLDKNPQKFKRYFIQAFPNLIKQICI